ncbi:hypothetical protein [Halorussus aquaticus]|uniref:Small CPxCG-related zinc finger protein n=1 Tax=Halorussus aquaticus TaxID=2953748 RepID=A0ABD5Q4Z1_9EURY|nr:hypothetical protein [Halorussus aquaticus]
MNDSAAIPKGYLDLSPPRETSTDTSHCEACGHDVYRGYGRE